MPGQTLDFRDEEGFTDHQRAGQYEQKRQGMQLPRSHHPDAAIKMFANLPLPCSEYQHRDEHNAGWDGRAFEVRTFAAPAESVSAVILYRASRLTPQQTK